MRHRPRRRHRHPRFGVLVVLGLFSFVVIGLTASNVVAGSHAADRSTPITVNTLKPTQCTMTLANIIYGNTGNGQNNLVLGTAAGATTTGQGGDDCVHGGGGNDTMRGGAGNDVCIGGAGSDTFAGSCEVQIP